MLRILFITDVFFYYLAPVVGVLADDCRVLVVSRDRGFEFGLGESDGEPFKRRLLDPRVGLCVVGLRQSDPRSLVSLCKARAVVHDFMPDIVHTQDHADWRLYAVERLGAARARRVLTVHDVVPHADERRSMNAVQRGVGQRLRAHAEAIVVHGEFLRRQTFRQSWYAGQRVQVIPHGVLGHPSSATPLPARPRVLFFGRAERYKGLDIFIRSVELAASQVPGLGAVIAAHGPDIPRCRALVRCSELFDWREGFIDDDALASLFSEVSALVAPYRDASQSGVVPLGFANGRPVIVTPVGSLPEAVDHGVNGFISTAATAESVAGAIVEVLGDRGRLEQMAGGALRTITTGPLSAAHVASEHLRLYAQLLSAGGR